MAGGAARRIAVRGMIHGPIGRGKTAGAIAG